MKKNKLMRLASALLVLTLLSTCAISGTFAKYTSSANGTSTATVAKWSFKVSGTEIAVTGDAKTVDFKLFDTINDTGNTADETDVVDNKIAPGTSGSFALKVQNTSEVTAEYTIVLAETNESNIPLQYSLTGTDNWVDSIAALNTQLAGKNLTSGAAETSHTIYWRWAFEGTGAHAGQTDTTDTKLGIDAQGTAPTVTITATVTATQVD